jgi:hypothetical protein
MQKLLIQDFEVTGLQTIKVRINHVEYLMKIDNEHGFHLEIDDGRSEFKDLLNKFIFI